MSIPFDPALPYNPPLQPQKNRLELPHGENPQAALAILSITAAIRLPVQPICTA
jgi:hypothetical protein